MYIQPICNNVNMRGSEKNSSLWKRIKQKILDAAPNATFNDSTRELEKWKKYTGFASHPAKNRFIMGITALATQPTIDYYNHKVDEETREISRCRTIAKIIAGTSVGMAVRGACYNIVEEMTSIKGNKKYSKTLLPSKYLRDLILDDNLLKNYRSALSTSIALIAMCVTNFVIDAPLTVFLTNYFNEKRVQAKEKQLEGGLENA